MSGNHAQDIDDGIGPDDHRKAQQYPRKIGSRECEQTEETHLNMGIPTAPHVNLHLETVSWKGVSLREGHTII